MTCSRPFNAIASDCSPLKKSRSRDLSCTKRGCESKSSDAKCINGRCPGVDFGVLKKEREIEDKKITPPIVVKNTHLKVGHADEVCDTYFANV